MTIESQTERVGAFRQVVRVDAHTLHADVAREIGGDSSAPSPHDYFDTSLATCKAITVAMYAKKHAIALERIDVRVDRDDSREREGTYALNVQLEFFGVLSDDDRRKLHDISMRCPIHKLMTTATIEIRSEPRTS